MLQLNKEGRRKIRKSAIYSGLIAFTIAVVVMVSVIKGKAEIVQYQAVRQGNILQYSVNAMLLNLDTLAAMVINGDGEVEHFYEICENLMEKSASENAIRSLQLAPNGVVTNICPEEGNEAGKIDLFADPDRKTEAEWARDTGITTLAGPYELLQGGFALVARMPIYMNGANGEKEFWGFVVEILDVDATLKPANLETFVKDGYDYCFWRKDPKTGEKLVICQSTENEINYPVTVDVTMPNVTWYFDVQPRGGWIPFEYIIGIILFILLSIITGVRVTYHRLSRQQRKDAAKKSNLLKKSLNNIANSVAVFKIQEKKLCPVIANRQFLEFMKLSENDFKEMNGDSFLEQIGCSCFRKECSCIDFQSIQNHDYEREIENPDTHEKNWFLINVRTTSDEDGVSLLYLTMTNINGEKKQEEKLQKTQKELADQIENGREWEYHAEHDPLTGLMNRKGYERIAARLNERNAHTGFVLIDIDHFKVINDDYGHETGDKILKKAASLLCQHIRETDHAFRFGGDEFVILLCDTDAKAAEFAAKRIHEMSEQMALAEEGIPAAHFSAGVYFSTSGVNDETYRIADEALYHTKKNGRMGCTVFDHDRNVLLEQHESVSNQNKISKNKVLSEVKGGIWRIEMPDDAPARLYCDEPMLELLGIQKFTSPEECYRLWYQGIDPEYVPFVMKAVDKILECGHAEVYYIWHHPVLGAMNIRCGGTCEKDYPNGKCIYGFHQNITETYIVTKPNDSKFMNDESSVREETDIITEELKMRGFLWRAENMLEKLPGDYAMLHLDIKGFKAINDQFGFENGNSVLKEVSDTIKNSKIKPLLITRNTADHFYCLAKKENIDFKEITRLCSQRFLINQTSVMINMNCGIYFIDDKSVPVRYLCDKARMAENAIKKDGSCPYFVFTNEMKQEYIRRRKIISTLDEAVENEEFYTYFQPVYDAKTGEIASSEALVRWIRPDGTVIPPDVFLPTLEENGQILRIDLIISKYVREFMEKRYREGKTVVPISVNLSRMDFYHEEAMQKLLDAVSNADIPKEYLRFEITESAYTDIPEQGKEMIKKLRKTGAKLLIDDFGKGYSSLGSIADQEFDIVKLDMSFVRQIGRNNRAEAVIKASIEMAHMMNAKVVAEGVETKEQYEFLRDTDCDYIQGYYFSKPLPTEKFVELLEE